MTWHVLLWRNARSLKRFRIKLSDSAHTHVEKFITKSRQQQPTCIIQSRRETLLSMNRAEKVSCFSHPDQISRRRLRHAFDHNRNATCTIPDYILGQYYVPALRGTGRRCMSLPAESAHVVSNTCLATLLATTCVPPRPPPLLPLQPTEYYHSTLLLLHCAVSSARFWQKSKSPSLLLLLLLLLHRSVPMLLFLPFDEDDPPLSHSPKKSVCSHEEGEGRHTTTTRNERKAAKAAAAAAAAATTSSQTYSSLLEHQPESEIIVCNVGTNEHGHQQQQQPS